jgi:hypothetical protein
MHMVEELLDRHVEGTGVEAELLLHVLGHRDLVLAGAPLEDVGAGAIDGERLHLHETRRAELERPSGRAEGELRHGETEQNENEDEAGNQPRDDNVAGQLAEHDHSGAEQPYDQQEPTGDERERAVLAAQGEKGDQPGADAGDRHRRGARQPRCQGRIDDGNNDQTELGGDPAPEQGLDPAVPQPDAEEGVEEEDEARR